MKSLRKTIRRILLENQQQYDKIVTLIMSLDPMNVNSALMFAESMGYAKLLSHTVEEREEFCRGTFAEKEMVEHHRWEFSPDDGLLHALETAWRKGFGRGVSGVGFHQPTDNNPTYRIYIVDKPSDRPSVRVQK